MAIRTTALRASRGAAALATTTTTTRPVTVGAAAITTTMTRTLSSSGRRLGGGADHAHHHEDHYDPPGGWLFGVAPGKYQNEGWEKIWIWGFLGSLGLAGVAYCYKPDTSIQTWALEEARRRLEAEGILKDPGLKKGDPVAQNTE